MNVLGLIPARFASTRFPGKPLVMIDGKSMIQRVYEQALKAKSLEKVFVATDDSRIYDHVKTFGGQVLMTSPDHPNGTARCLEAFEMVNVKYRDHFGLIINIQGDEPYIDPSQLDKVASLFIEPSTQIGTLVKKITSNLELFDPNVVKAVFGAHGDALYFSRQTIPYLRDTIKEKWLETTDFYKHIGIYAYRPDVLKKIAHLAEGKLEKSEKLEQLRWLEQNMKVRVEITESESVAIDTPDDLLKLSNNR